jgi:hypothetical protein
MVETRADEETTGMKIGTAGQASAAGHDGARPFLALGLAFAMALVGFCLWSASADAYEGITKWEMAPSTTQAGGHPDVSMGMEWNNSVFKDGQQLPPSNPCGCDDARVIRQHFPTGFIGNIHAVPQCELVEFSFGRCPAASQVGIISPLFGELYSPLYSITPHPNEAGLTGFWVPLAGAPVFIALNGRTDSDYGLDAESSPVYHPLPLNTLSLTLWGVPADPVHDFQRFIPPLKGFASCNGPVACPEVTGIAANVPPVPFLQNPTECGVPLTGTLEIEYYTHNTVRADAPWPETTGCEQLTFNPSLTAKPTTTQSDAPAGVDVDLRVPQELSATTPSPSEIKASTTIFPEGVSINPSAADGKVSCSDADTAIGTRRAATCPEFSKVGTLTLDSAALPEPLPGAIYLGDPKPGHRFRLLLAADGFGTHFKIAGFVNTNPQTGRMEVTFPDLPQSPLTEFNMHFFGSERGLLATPAHCGGYTVRSIFTPWDQLLPTQESLGTFVVDQGPNGTPCPGRERPFSPALKAGSVNTTGGMHTPYVFELNRSDGDQNIDTISVTPPPGLLARLKGIPYCPDSALAQLGNPDYLGATELALSKCPASSRIGSSNTAVGAGTRPLFLPGSVYLAGPYGGAPLSLAVVTPAVSGPYDLGNVVVRAGISVDPVTADVTTTSDPLPQILGGVPLRIRTVRISLDRPDFMLNPTNCDQFATLTAITGSEGGNAVPGAPYQAANCASLAFAPKLSLSFTGGTKRRGHPALQAVIRRGEGEANVGRAVVTLPKGEQLDNAHINSPCTRVQFAADKCPPESVIGSAVAETPLLDRPLQGPVYLRSSSHDLPDLVADLKGQFDIELTGRISTSKGGAMRTTFESLPDAPVSKFTLSLLGGKKGLLINSTDACASGARAVALMTGQNGAVSRRAVRPTCGSKNARNKRQGRRHSHRKGVR